MHLAWLFHAKSKAIWGILHVSCAKMGLKAAKWLARCRHSPLASSQQPHARMRYLRAMGKSWRARAAIMLKFMLKTLHVEMVCTLNTRHCVWEKTAKNKI